MRTDPGPVTAHIAARIRELRRAREWSGERMAREMAVYGVDWWNRTTVAKLETGRRASISVDELIAAAKSLQVPVMALLPPDAPGNTLTFEQAVGVIESRYAEAIDQLGRS